MLVMKAIVRFITSPYLEDDEGYDIPEMTSSNTDEQS